jgi:hypothetical protein
MPMKAPHTIAEQQHHRQVVSSNFIKDIAALGDSLASEQRNHAHRAQVLEALAAINREHQTDAEIASALLRTGLSEQEIRRRLKLFEGVVHSMILSIAMHVRLESLERQPKEPK